MGTPDISVKSFLALEERYEVIGLFCGEDKPIGRKQTITPPPTKVAAEKLGIPVYQPKSLKSRSSISLIKELNPDLIVVLAYGKILPKEILDIPKYGVINAHASLLPKYRGASPVQYALMNNEEVTGVSIMRIDEGIDTGDIILQREIPLSKNSDANSVFSNVSELSAELLLKTVEMLTNGTVEYTKQDSSLSSYAPIISKELGEFSFSFDAKKIVGLVKGLVIWPTAYYIYKGKRIKVLEASFSKEEGEIGEILSLKPLTVSAKNGSIELIEVMPESKGKMSGTAYALGLHLTVGDRLE